MVSTDEISVRDVPPVESQEIEHMLIDEDNDGSLECLLVTAGSNEKLASEWITAAEDSYVSLSDAQ